MSWDESTVPAGGVAAADPGEGSDLPHLLIFDGNASWRHPLLLGEVDIGRAPECAIRMNDPAVSRRHARLRVAGPDDVVLEDLASHNGVSVNGERVRGHRRLVPDDIVAMGDATLVVCPRGEGPRAATSRETVLDLAGHAVVVADPAMARTFATLERYALTDLPILLLGETGSGKEVAARALHHWSPRAEAPFLPINCAALPETLADGELFGYTRFAFSGAGQAKPGLLEAANGGTVFLDEIAELPLAIQSKFLRILDSGRFLRLGEVRERATDVRVVAATNRDLGAEVQAGRFREDLLHRVRGAVVNIPSLRERPRDIVAFARRFLNEAAREQGRRPVALTPDAEQALVAHPFPGNVRELRNLMVGLAAVCTGNSLDRALVEAQLAPAASSRAAGAAGAAAPAPRLDDEVQALERARMVAALEASGGNRSEAAASLGMPRRTFTYKLRRYGIE